MDEGNESAAPTEWTRLMPADAPAARSSDRRRRHRRPGKILRPVAFVLAVVTAGIGVAAVVAAAKADDRSADTRQRTASLQRQRHRNERAIDEANHGADGPIGIAERVVTSVSSIGSASGDVLGQASGVDDILGRAVDLANSGNFSGAGALYDGEAAEAINRLESLMAEARVLLAAAQQSSAELRAGA